MARYTESVCRLCRREGAKLFLKGTRCYTKKCSFERRPTPPGQHGVRRRKVGDYGLQLREKQKVRKTYGVLERQFRNYFEKAARAKGVTGEVLLQMLERRLDNVVFRLGFSNNRAQARQLVRHQHFSVNGRKVDVPSFLVRVGDTVQVRDKSRNLTVIQGSLQARKGQSTPEWLEVNGEAMNGRVLSIPARGSITTPINEQLIVELYSK